MPKRFDTEHHAVDKQLNDELGGSALAPGELKRSQLGLKKPAREGEGLRERNSGLVHLVPLGDETKSP